MDKQTVYCHLANHSKRPMLNKVLWEILHPNINVFYIRKMIKALEIKRCNEANMSIMNGG